MGPLFYWKKKDLQDTSVFLQALYCLAWMRPLGDELCKTERKWQRESVHIAKYGYSKM